ncbi:S41 family peptidase [Chitinophaga filiformis]|nr:S41 family peptidase [Chitinophaga filiformis]
MREQEFLSLITLLHSKIDDGHTMFLPSEATTDANNSTGRFLPFSLTYTDGRLYIIENCSSDTSIGTGEEIISINGEDIAAVMSRLMARQIRDGYNQTYPVWILNHYFAAYYSFAYGHPPQFNLELKDNKDRRYKKQIEALTKDSIQFFRQIRYPTVENRGITLEENKDNATAILTISSFDADLLGAIYKQGYKYAIDSIFARLKRDRISNLILDLRDNQGGDFEPGRYLLSYLLAHQSRYLLQGEEARLLQPKNNHFTGKLFVLINGGSFSNTAIVSACLEQAQRAIFIGEETGGNRSVISGNPTEISLPKTQIRGFISTTTFQITTGIGDGHGVLPTYQVLPTITEILTGKDMAKALALKLISKQ